MLCEIYFVVIYSRFDATGAGKDKCSKHVIR